MNLKKIFVLFLAVIALPLFVSAQALTQTAKDSQLKALQSQLATLQRNYNNTKAQFDAQLAKMQQQIDAVIAKINTLNGTSVVESMDPKFTFVSGTIVGNSSFPDNMSITSADVKFVVKIKAGANDITINNLAADNIYSSTGFSINSTNLAVGKISNTDVTSDAEIVQGSNKTYIVRAGQEKTFEITAIINKIGNGNVAGKLNYLKYWVTGQSGMKTFNFPYNSMTNSIVFGSSTTIPNPPSIPGYSTSSQINPYALTGGFKIIRHTSPAANVIIGNGEEKIVAGYKIDIQASDIVLKNFNINSSVDYTTNSMPFVRFAQEIALYDGEEELYRFQDLNPSLFKIVPNGHLGELYELSFPLNYKLNKRTTHYFYIKIKAKNEFIPPKKLFGIWLGQSSVKGIDEKGVNQYAGSVSAFPFGFQSNHYPEISLIPTPKITKIVAPNAASNDTAEGEIRFNIKAVGGDIYIPLYNTNSELLSLVSSSNKSAIHNPSLITNATIDGGKYIIRQGEIKTFVLKNIITPNASGNYDMVFGSLMWGINGNDMTSIFSGEHQWNTGGGYLQANWKTQSIYLKFRGAMGYNNNLSNSMQASLRNAQMLLDQLKAMLP